MTLKCECPEIGELGCFPSWYDPVTELPFVNHEPKQCLCTNQIKLYRRKTTFLHLCSICCLIGDVEQRQ